MIGILGLQGNFLEHQQTLKLAGADSMLVKSVEDLKKVNALIIPGGESTTFSILLERTGLAKAIKQRVKNAMPVLATCAGAIVASSEIIEPKGAKPLSLIDITTKRNAFGRQRESFEAKVKRGEASFNAKFIRAPAIERTGQGVKIIAQLDGKPVWVESGKIIVVTFHTELDGNPIVHKRLLEIIG